MYSKGQSVDRLLSCSAWVSPCGVNRSVPTLCDPNFTEDWPKPLPQTLLLSQTGLGPSMAELLLTHIRQYTQMLIFYFRKQKLFVLK